MPTCGPGDSTDFRGPDFRFGRGREAYARGASDLPHIPSDLSGPACPAAAGVIRVQQNQRVRLHLPLTDGNGDVISLPIGAEESSAGSSEPSSEPYGWKAVFVVKHQTGDSRPVICVDAEYLPESDSVFEVSLRGSDLRRPGLFVSQLVVLIDDEVRFATTYWLEVAAVGTERSASPLTISELRLRLRDVCPEANEVLQDFEYTDDEIALAIRDPVDEFNATRPPRTSYTTSTFPWQWRYQWARASLAVLMKMASRKYLRDHLPYDAGGVAVDSKNKFKEYNAFADELHGEWLNFIYEQKARMNAQRGYGRLRSGYSRF